MKKPFILSAKNIFVLLILSTLFFCCNKNEAKIRYDKGGVIVENPDAQVVIHDGEKREYVLYVPDSYDGIAAVPILFNFHGYGGSASEYMMETDMRSLAESETFILVYPQGSLLNGSPHWNPSLPGIENKSNADDLGFIEALINKLSTEYVIDMKRIYACGYSNGGMMSYGLASHKSNLIAAVASISGAMIETDVTPSHPMPVIKIHGTADEVLPYNGINGAYNSVEATLAYWRDFNRTNTTPVVRNFNDNGTVIEHFIYTDGDRGAVVEHYKVIEGEHVWFDLNYQGTSLNKLIWDFVSKYDINGLL